MILANEQKNAKTVIITTKKRTDFEKHNNCNSNNCHNKSELSI